MIFINSLIPIILLTVTLSASGQHYLLPNEVNIFSFTTQTGKQVALNRDKENKYIIYRYGTKDKIEFEFPHKSKSSWSNFKYSFLLRDGGTQNEGLDLNYLYFINKGFKYVIYDTYFSVGQMKNVGIKIFDLKSDKTTNIKGNNKTRKGTLVDFRDNGLVEIGEETFD